MDGVAVVEPLRWRRVPMLAAVAAFAAGDVLARQWQATFFLAAASSLLFLIAAWRVWRRARIAMVPVLALWVVVGCWCARMQPPVVRQHEIAQYADGLSRTVRGRVVRVRDLRKLTDNVASPEMADAIELGAWEKSRGTPTESVDLDVQAVEEVTPDVSTMRPVTGGVRVSVIGEAPLFACGDVVEMPLRLREPEIYRDPGAWSQMDALLAQGIGAEASVKAPAVQRVGSASAGWRCRVYAAQTWAAGRMDALEASHANAAMPGVLRLRAQDAVMLNAMMFGDRQGLTRSLRVGFERTGTFHLFVVSGLHIVLLSGAMFWILRKARVPESVAVLTTIVLATDYALLTGFGVPVQRALGMTVVVLLARWLVREAGTLNALGAAALVVLTIDPRALFEASFQMTFLVIASIAGLAVPTLRRGLAMQRSALHELDVLRMDAAVHPRVAQRRVQIRMWRTLLVSLCGEWVGWVPQGLLTAVVKVSDVVVIGLVTEICMVLPMAVYFHRATLLALPVNMLAIPLVAGLMCVAIPMFLLSLVNAWVAMVPGAATALLLHLVGWVVGHVGQTAIADLRVPAPSGMLVAAACAAMVFACWALRERRRVAWSTGLLAVALIPLLLLWPEQPVMHGGVLEVTALDVGQGDSLLVVSPDGHTLLVDAGGPVGQAPSPDRWDVGEEVVAPYLWTRRIRRLDAMMLTHGHSDHMGGMHAVLRDLRPRELWLSVQPAVAPDMRALLAEAAQLGVRVHWFRAGDAFAWGGLQASVLAPEPDYANAGTAVNNDSLVMRLGFGKAGVLLEGDAEAPSEAAMLQHGRVTQATLLKVGHHGSRTSTNPDFLAAVSPKDAMISVGKRNTFGHPRFEVLQRLEAAHVKTFRTDRVGAETFLLTSDGGISASAAASN